MPKLNMSNAVGLAKAAARIVYKGFFAVLMLATSLCIFVPFSPAMPGAGLDQSWCLGMNQAVAQGLSFGNDVIFTFGPYASIFTKSYHPATDSRMVWGSLYLGVSFALAAWLAFKDCRWYWRLLFMLTLSGLTHFGSGLLASYYPLLAGVYVVRSASSVPPSGKASPGSLLLLIALFSPLGLLPLIQGTLMVLSAAIVALSVLLLALRRDWRCAACVAVSPIASLLVFWTLAGQSLRNMPSYFLNMLPIIRGYTEAMAIGGDESEIVSYLLAAALLSCAVLLYAKLKRAEKACLLLMFTVVLFVAFKDGFVRHDAHALASGTMILLAAMLLGSICDLGFAMPTLFLAGFAWLYIDGHNTRTSSQVFLDNVTTTFESAWNSLSQRGFDRAGLKHDFDEAIARLHAESGFPRLPGTTDIYSCDQAYLIASGNDWNPRPIPQSYAVYTPALAEKNAAHLIGKNAPDNLIFKMQPIDGRIPSLEDGASWPVIFSDYEPDQTRNGYLFLRRRGVHREISQSVISAEKRSLGEVVKVPASSSTVFAKINFTRNLLGTLADTFYKSSDLTIDMELADGSRRSYRIISGMAKTGFLLSPLIANTDEFAAFYGGSRRLEGKKVKTISIDAKRSWMWNKEYEVEFVQFDLPASTGAAPPLVTAEHKLQK